MIDIIGTIAAVLTTLSFVPQAVLVIRTRRTEGISLAMYAMFTAGVAAWLIYGISLGAMPIIIANVVTLALASIILTIKIRSVLPAQPSAQGATAATSAPIAS
ncbi:MULTISPECIES: SemiSWEET transporter [Hyphomonas]|uniref:MtN3/saliva-related transmembrane protein, conserved region n=2 Tax=Hyphomonas adhaerens TaxID=81029 RepID=A0A069E3E4_9PROT|nr:MULTISPECIES: SemiSWEET transporter [Hyphomonas]KCZ84498.1 MtN3/saliva-related transmembrane protein, conserved region [Hyphomonas adhaerens MHS-3]MBB39816.1 glutathione synthetase [Hyphomonas sp.]HAE26166.1 glutathione synthetase [Hyphomonas adhaerens]|tara:strand:- start:2830 stop:3138 length:309 start_codon:yes stop_codon:yes gene_type:complete